MVLSAFGVWGGGYIAFIGNVVCYEILAFASNSAEQEWSFLDVALQSSELYTHQ